MKTRPEPTQRFSDRVANYIKYRPGYPVAAIQYLIKACTLNPHSFIADAGSGTGIFTKLLLDQGLFVYAIEPNEPMRQAAEELLADYKTFRSVNGAAAHTTLPDASIDLIVCAQAFHWFNNEATKTEFKRILKPGGHVALIWNNRLTDIDEFSIGYELLLKQLASDYSEVNHQNIKERDFIAFFKDGKYTLTKYPNVQVFDEDGLIGRALSSSYVPSPTTAEGAKFFTSLKALFAQYQSSGTVNFQYQTEIYLGGL